jgi:hypothetical protein
VLQARSSLCCDPSLRVFLAGPWPGGQAETWPWRAMPLDPRSGKGVVGCETLVNYFLGARVSGVGRGLEGRIVGLLGCRIDDKLC